MPNHWQTPMSLDLRLPIRPFFGLLGILLAGYGLASDPAI